VDVERGVVRAWGKAAHDLGITVTADGALLQDGHSYPYLLHVGDFGRPNGTICVVAPGNEGEIQALRRVALDQDFYFSVLTRVVRRIRPGAILTATLDDWQWFGAAKPPPWYTGKPWGQ
jgi:hypothetical protein